MDSWIVSRNPIGVFESPWSQTAASELKVLRKSHLMKACTDNLFLQSYTFLYKAHILAGQAMVDGEKVKDFAWLTKEEVQKRVAKDYWEGVKDVLSDF